VVSMPLELKVAKLVPVIPLVMLANEKVPNKYVTLVLTTTPV